MEKFDVFILGASIPCLFVGIYKLLKELGVWPETWHKKYYEKDSLSESEKEELHEYMENNPR